MRSLQTFGALAVVALVVPPVASAQEGPRNSLSLSAGAMQFDLSGTGTTTMVALRVDRAFAPIFVGEVGFGLSRPDQQFGATTTFFVPEAQLQLQAPLRRVLPYLGVGAGWAIDFRDDAFFGDFIRATFSGALGSRFLVSERIGARAELRVRGIGTSFGGSTAEWTAGVAWRF